MTQSACPHQARLGRQPLRLPATHPMLSGGPDTFFDSLASTAWSSDPIAGRSTLGMRDLLSASTNGIPTETCDFDETLHASALPLEGQ